jgi:lactoylglutathione lyase
LAIKKIDHIGLLIKNPEPAIEFYKNVLNFEVSSEKSLHNMHVNVYDLKTQDDYIEIIQPTSNEIMMSNGIKHIAFLSDDIEADYESIKNSGVELLHKEIQRHKDVSFFFMKSPGGEFIEIIQYS